MTNKEKLSKVLSSLGQFVGHEVVDVEALDEYGVYRTMLNRIYMLRLCLLDRLHSVEQKIAEGTKDLEDSRAAIRSEIEFFSEW